MDDLKEEFHDLSIEVNLGTKEDPWITYVSGHLGSNEFNRMVAIL